MKKNFFNLFLGIKCIWEDVRMKENERNKAQF